MLQDGSRMAQDGFKDHPGDFPGCGVCEFQDAPGWVQGWPRMALRIILGCGVCGWFGWPMRLLQPQKTQKVRSFKSLEDLMILSHHDSFSHTMRGSTALGARLERIIWGHHPGQLSGGMGK